MEETGDVQRISWHLAELTSPPCHSEITGVLLTHGIGLLVLRKQKWKQWPHWNFSSISCYTYMADVWHQ